MEDILAYLESITQPDSMGPKHTALMETLCALQSSILKDVPLPSLDELSNAWNKVQLFECQECFSRGFRLGVRLILAAWE